MFRFVSCRALLLLGVTAGVLPPLSSAQEIGSQVEQHFHAAQQDQQQGLLDAAVREYQTVLRLQPGIPEV